MKKTLLFFCAILVTTIVKGQDDLLSILEEEDESGLPVLATFKTTRIINGQSVELTAPGVLNFIVGHRFGKLNDGAYHLFGLDQSTVRLGFEYGISNRFMLGLGRSSFRKTYDGSIKYKPVMQREGGDGFPFSIVLYSGLALNTLRWAEPERDNLFSSRLSYFYQILIARKFSPDLSLQVSPTLIHRNMVETSQDPNDVYAIGLGGRYRITSRFTLNVEYFYQLPGAKAENTHNSLSLGFDIDTGGHIFQLHVTNSQGMVENYFIADTNGEVSRGDLYFGFNINRVFNISKKKD